MLGACGIGECEPEGPARSRSGHRRPARARGPGAGPANASEQAGRADRHAGGGERGRRAGTRGNGNGRVREPGDDAAASRRGAHHVGLEVARSSEVSSSCGRSEGQCVSIGTDGYTPCQPQATRAQSILRESRDRKMTMEYGIDSENRDWEQVDRENRD
jgi:hypothetical protein